MKILIIDRQATFRQDLIGLLQKNPEIEVIDEAASCLEAIEKVRDHKPDLVLLDIDLPDCNWLYLLQEILAVSQEIKVVVLSEHESDESLLDSIRYGAKGYLVKGLEAANMLATLQALGPDEFILSPKMAQLVLTDYSQIKESVDNAVDLDKLTARERDVLWLICKGASNREIARKLVISENTVRIHIQNIFKKLKLKNRRQAQEKYSIAMVWRSTSSNFLSGTSIQDDL